MISVITLFKAFCFIFGLLIGSFLNVVILRMPLGKSIVTPRSACSKCGYQLKWYDNIPIISYLLLKGKCRSCDESFSIRYPLIELVTGLIALNLFPDVINIQTMTLFSFQFSVACILLVHLMIDIDHHLLLDKINLFFLAIVTAYLVLFENSLNWVFGGLIGFLGPYLITYAFYKFRGVVGLGGGDIKLFGILGLILGPMGILSNIFMSCLLGSVVGLGLIVGNKMGKDTPFAFGPYIIVVAAIQIYFPELFSRINFLSF